MPTAGQVNWAKLRVAAMSVAAFTILAVIFYLLTGGTLLQEKATLYMLISDATGIGSGSPVRVDGIDVGKVSAVALSGYNQPDRIVRLTMTVERQWLSSIPVDSWAQLSAETLIGDKYVDITSGISRTPIAPNGTVIYRENPDIMKRLDLTQFRKQIAQVDAVLIDIQAGQGPLGEFVQGTGFYDEWLKLLRESQAAVDKLASPTGELGQEVYSDATYRRLRQTVLDFNQAITRFQSQGTSGAMLRDDSQYQQLMGSLGDLRHSVAQVGSSSFFQSDEDYRNWSRSLASFARSVQEFDASAPMETSEMYDHLTGLARQLHSDLKDFQVNPKKYLQHRIF